MKESVRLLGGSVLLALLIAAGTGCASSGWQSDAVPLPSSTPFDSNQMARNVYLEGFRSGYRAQLSGTPHGLELAGGPFLHARQRGFEAGAAHARAQQTGEIAPVMQVTPGR